MSNNGKRIEWLFSKHYCWIFYGGNIIFTIILAGYSSHKLKHQHWHMCNICMRTLAFNINSMLITRFEKNSKENVFVSRRSPGQILSIVVHKVDLTPFVVTLFAHIITTRFPMIQIFWLLIRITIVDECVWCWLTSFRYSMLL